METIVRKEWGSPKGNVQEFTPQEYCSDCGVFPGDLPDIASGKNFFIDGWDNGTSGNGHSHVADGKSAGTESVTGDMKSEFPGAFKGKSLQEYLNGNAGYYHVDQGYKEVYTVNPGPSIQYTDYYFSPVILLHVGKRQFYYLADGYVSDSDPLYYIPDSVKNQS